MADDFPVDPEDLELAALEEAEQAGEPPGGEAPPAAGEVAAPAAEDVAIQTDAIQAGAARSIPGIPKPRFDEVLGRARELELENARLKGVLEGARSPQPQAPAPPPRQQTPEEARAEIEARKDQIWEQYDQGAVSFADMKRQEAQLDRLQRQIDEAVRDQQRPVGPPPVAADLRLQELTDQMAAQHPWVNHVPAAYLQGHVAPLALDLLRGQGIRIGNDAASTLRLRQAVVQVAYQMGAHRLYAPPETWPADPQAGAAAGPGSGPSRPTAQLSPAEVKAKLALAARAAPDVTGLGSAATALGARGAKDIARMSEDELASLSPDELEELAPSRSR